MDRHAPPPNPPPGEHLSFGMEPPVRRSIRRWAYLAMALAMLFGLAIAFGPLALATYRLKHVCQSLEAGAAWADVQTQAAAAGLMLGPPIAGEAELGAGATRIKATCTLNFDEGSRLRSARFSDD